MKRNFSSCCVCCVFLLSLFFSFFMLPFFRFLLACCYRFCIVWLCYRQVLSCEHTAAHNAKLERNKLNRIIFRKLCSLSDMVLSIKIPFSVEKLKRFDYDAKNIHWKSDIKLTCNRSIHLSIEFQSIFSDHNAMACRPSYYLVDMISHNVYQWIVVFVVFLFLLFFRRLKIFFWRSTERQKQAMSNAIEA